MSETQHSGGATETASSARSSRVDDIDERGGEVVHSEGGGRGVTTIAEQVVVKVASIAAREVEGVDSLGGAISGAISGVVGRVRGDEYRTAGVTVEVGTKQAAVDLNMKVKYPYPIHEVAEAARQNIIDRIEALTGLHVVEVNVAVTDLVFESDDGQGGGDENSRVE